MHRDVDDGTGLVDGGVPAPAQLDVRAPPTTVAVRLVEQRVPYDLCRGADHDLIDDVVATHPLLLRFTRVK
jgi:hypothetical protein